MGDALVQVIALTEQTRAGLTELEKQQFPFALASALTEVAAMSVIAVQNRTRAQFDLHGEFIPRGIAKVSAKKGDVRATGIGKAIVYTKPLISGFMPIHEGGGTRTPASKSGTGDAGKALTQPARDVLSKSYRTSTGRVRARWKPTTLLQGYTRGKGRTVSMTGGIVKASRGGRKGKPFIIRAQGSGTAMIVRRKSSTRYPLELLYVFSKRAKYKPVWRFEHTVNDVVDKMFTSILRTKLKDAVETAR